MLVIDDPMLALILRFVGHEKDINESTEEFLKQQMACLHEYVSGFPESEQEMRAMEWVENNAVNYRRKWERQLATNEVSHVQCDDCPMKNIGGASICIIHQEWLDLLEAYCSDNLSTEHYIKYSLKLLQKHKKNLKYQQFLTPDGAMYLEPG